MVTSWALRVVVPTEEETRVEELVPVATPVGLADYTTVLSEVSEGLAVECEARCAAFWSSSAMHDS